MKKTLSLIISLVLCFSMFGCGKTVQENEPLPSSQKESTPQSVELTVDNISQYLSFSASYTDFEFVQEGSKDDLWPYSGTATLNFQAYSIVPGSFTNVEISVDFGDGGFFDWNPSSHHFTLPSSGTYTYTTTVDNSACSSTYTFSSREVTVRSVKGTFTPAD